MMINNNLHITFSALNMLASINYMIKVLMYNRHNPGALALLKKVESVHEVHEKYPKNFDFFEVQSPLKLLPQGRDGSPAAPYIEMTLEAGEDLKGIHDSLKEQFDQLSLETPQPETTPQHTIQSLIGSPVHLRSRRPKSEQANIKELSPRDEAWFRAMADTYPRTQAEYREEPSLEKRIGAALFVLMNPNSPGTQAELSLCWPASTMRRGAGRQLAMEWIKDILLTLLARLPSEDLAHIHRTLLERLNAFLPPEPEHGNYHTDLAHMLSQRAEAPQSQHTQRDHPHNKESQSRNAQHSPSNG